MRIAAAQVLTFIERKANETGHVLSDEIMSFVKDVKNIPWDQAYEKTMIYRIVPESARASMIKQKLPFLTEKEAENTKSYLDFICDFAGRT